MGLSIKVDSKRLKDRGKPERLDTLDGDFKSTRLHPDQAKGKADPGTQTKEKESRETSWKE